MLNVLVPVMFGYLIGNAPARERVERFVKTTLTNGLSMLDKRAVKNDVVIKNNAEDGGSASGTTTAAPIIPA